jgi:hypothetical protein
MTCSAGYKANLITNGATLERRPPAYEFSSTAHEIVQANIESTTACLKSSKKNTSMLNLIFSKYFISQTKVNRFF